jgi:hypothetical protein
LLHAGTFHASLGRHTEAMEQSLPSGTLTLLFSDIEGSTRLVSQLGVQGGDETTTETGRDSASQVGPFRTTPTRLGQAEDSGSQGASVSVERARSRQSELIWPERDCRNDPPHTSM